MDRDQQVLRVVLIEGTVNCLIVLVKLAVGLSTGSLVILGDAAHSLTDVMNNVVAWFVVHFSSAPADKEHPYGHRKFETLAVFGLASLLVVLAVELALHAVRREDVLISGGALELGLMSIVLALNLTLSIWERGWSQRLGSDILSADAKHTFADAVTTVAVIAGWQLSLHGYPWLDSIFAIAVAALILYLAVGLFQRTIPSLVDQSSVESAALVEATRDVKGVRAVQRVRSRWIGSDAAVDMTVLVDSKLSLVESHSIADQIEALLGERFNVSDVTIHVEPLSI